MASTQAAQKQTPAGQLQTSGQEISVINQSASGTAGPGPGKICLFGWLEMSVRPLARRHSPMTGALSVLIESEPGRNLLF
jgi:hypothetical protein